MPSPFPGMDPYLENTADWLSFHTPLLVDLQRAIISRLSDDYEVVVEQRLYVERDPPEVIRSRHFARADVGLSRGPRPARATATMPIAAAGAPVTGRIAVAAGVSKPRRWLTIRDRERRRVVTVIELLSPTDKTLGRDRDKYLAKRDRILNSTAGLVEIDLLRGGHRTPVEGRPVCDYCVVVSRRGERPAAGIWAWGVRDPMPSIPIPLMPGEPEPVVSLRAALDATYDGSRLGRRLYDELPDPPLSASDSSWAATLLKPPAPARGRKRPPR